MEKGGMIPGSDDSRLVAGCPTLKPRQEEEPMARKLLLIALLVTSLSCVGWAQPARGDLEFSLAGTGTSTDDFDNNSLGFDGELGTYISDGIELAVRQAFSWFDPNVGDSNWYASTRVAADWHFGTDLRPFVGANVGGMYGDVDDAMFWAPEAGIKWYALETTFIFGRAEYQIPFDSDKDESFIYTFGVGFNW